jgi:hypothetical protein
VVGWAEVAEASGVWALAVWELAAWGGGWVLMVELIARVSDAPQPERTELAVIAAKPPRS